MTKDNDNKITISFGFTNEFGNTYKASSSLEPAYSFGESELDCIGRQLIAFLRQITYPMQNDYLLMEDLTEDELWHLKDELWEYRNRDKEENAEGENE